MWLTFSRMCVPALALLTTRPGGPSANSRSTIRYDIQRSLQTTLFPADAQARRGQPIPCRTRTYVEVALAGGRLDLLVRRVADDLECTGAGFNQRASTRFR